MKARGLAFLLVMLAASALANDKLVRIYAPDTLIESGLLNYALPRFSLKTQVRIEYTTDIGAADLALGDAGRVLFQGPNQQWKLDVRSGDHPGTQRLAEWLRSDVGQRTIASYAPDGVALFGAPVEEAEDTVELAFDGNAELGHKVSRSKCTRCHAVDDATEGWGIGSTPSFAVIKALSDWDGRFASFYALNPHPAFMQIEDLTDPFPIDRPSPIAPIHMTIDELEAMLAYVAVLPAADLGKALDHQ